MKNLAKKIEACKKYGNLTNESYTSKMGGQTKVIITKSKEVVFEHIFDERNYYSGRGTKYNSDINHSYTLVELSLNKLNGLYKEVCAYYKKKAEEIAKIKIQKMEKKKKYNDFASQGLYEIIKTESGSYVNLSEEESNKQYFDVERLANTLDIEIDDARLLTSRGKTYVFAEQILTGKILILYHASLFCNSLNISIEEATPEQIERFNKERESWVNAPFADQVGQTNNNNHFVC